MTLATPGTTEALHSYRKTDAVLIVCQNNAKKTVEIAAINEEATRLLGYTNPDIVSKPLSAILPERINSTIAEFVGYEEDSNDLLAVLGKVRNFSVKSADGNEHEFRLRIIRGEAMDKNPWFHLVLVNEEAIRQSNAFRNVLKENFKGHEVLDERTGLPDRASIIKDLELVVYHVRDKNISASFAIIDIHFFEGLLKEYGSKVCTQLHQHIAKVCKLKLRPEDTIGTLSERLLGLILVDAAHDATRMILNRLRWEIGISPLELSKKRDLLAQVNIVYIPVDGREREGEILEKSESFALSRRNKAINGVELVIPEERRKANVPVAVDQRKRGRKS